MPLSTGSRLGPYEVVGAIGSGGMGEVYRARDSKLHRDVAIKILPEPFAHDTERRARLTREAQVLASLNHPGIAHIYGIEDSPAGPALVMELVEGPTLADMIARSRPGLAEALDIARRLADALEAAHEHGVIHRDLKPANVKVRSDGTVKVLDFGLAKALEPLPTASGIAVSNSPTLTSPAATALGMILGTAAYMAPEQARGKPVDKRADIWAFGCVLYEMLTGRRPFAGDDVVETIGAVIHKEPDWTALPRATPSAVRAVLEHTLRKDPRQRLRDIGDVRLVLDGAFENTAAIVRAVPAPAARRRKAVGLAVAALSLVTATGFGVWTFMRPEPARLVRLSALHSGPGPVGGAGADILLTPDGRQLVYLAGPPAEKQIYVRRLDELTPRSLGARGSIVSIFMSPDGLWVGFSDAIDRSLKKIPIAGGAAMTLCKALDSAPLAPTWGDGDRIIFTVTQPGRGQGLWSVPASGGTPEVVLAPNEERREVYGWPRFLPGGQAILFDVAPLGGQINDPGQHSVEALNLQTGARTPLIEGGGNAHYAPSGHLIFSSGDAIRAMRFDLDALAVIGSPVQITDEILTKPANAIVSLSVSRNGTLAYIRGVSEANSLRTIVWVDRQGREEPIAVPRRAYAYARLSPDETRLALDVRDEQLDIWIWDLRRQTFTRLTSDPSLNRAPVWTPDGSRVAFSALIDNAENIYWQLADGSKPAEPLTTNRDRPLSPRGFSPDGKTLLVGQPNAPFDLLALSVEGERHLQSLLSSSFDESAGVISPDGRWLAYQSNESGRYEVYVRPFPNISAGRWPVSRDGGGRPAWSHDGRELFYSALPPSAGTIFSVPVQSGSTFMSGTPTVVVKGPYLAPQTGRHYDPASDGRFLVIKDARTPDELSVPPQLVVVENWVEELKRLAP